MVGLRTQDGKIMMDVIMKNIIIQGEEKPTNLDSFDSYRNQDQVTVLIKY